MPERALISELPNATGLLGVWEGANSPGWGEATSLRKVGLVAMWRARARCPARRQTQERRYRPRYIRQPRKLNFQVGSGPPEIVDILRGCAWDRDPAMAGPRFGGGSYRLTGQPGWWPESWGLHSPTPSTSLCLFPHKISAGAGRWWGVPVRNFAPPG